jgi:multidrug efflux system outer membrane protein
MKKIGSRKDCALLSVLLLTACTVGPEYNKPEVPVPSSFRSQINMTEAGSFADQPWWGIFQDKALQQLIREALANNNDLRLTIARIDQARAQVEIINSKSLPQIGYQGTAAGERSVIAGRNTAQATTFGAFEGLLSAAWEFDVWGRIKHATDAAKADLLGQEDVRHGVMLTLVSDLAADYFRLLELDRELAIAQESAATYKKTLDLFTFRFEAGKDSKLPVERAQASYDASTALTHDLARQIGQTENAISTLIGAYPRAIERGAKLEDQTMPAAPVGTTTALLQRRPDILQAEQGMIAANAKIGEAVADFFPRIGISTLAGGQGIVTGGGWSAFGVWSAALSAAGPIYSGGGLEGSYHQRQAYWDETIAAYRQKVLVAFQETADALKARETLPLRRTALISQVAALKRSTDLALMRYDAGRASYFEVLEAQQQYFDGAYDLAKTERDELLAVVNLYKALGGGWSADPSQPEPSMPGQGATLKHVNLALPQPAGAMALETAASANTAAQGQPANLSGEDASSPGTSPPDVAPTLSPASVVLVAPGASERDQANQRPKTEP